MTYVKKTMLKSIALLATAGLPLCLIGASDASALEIISGDALCTIIPNEEMALAEDVSFIDQSYATTATTQLDETAANPAFAEESPYSSPVFAHASELANNVQEDELDETRGAGLGENFIISQNAYAVLQGNSANNTVSGANSVENSFNNVAGVVTNIQNSGNNVVIQNSFILNMQTN